MVNEGPVRTFMNDAGDFVRRRADWDLDEWPRVRDLQQSLAWIRSRLERVEEPEAEPDAPLTPFDAQIDFVSVALPEKDPESPPAKGGTAPR